MAQRHRRRDELRQSIAAEAARIMLASGNRDYYQAKTKAAARLGVSADSDLPRNADVDTALKAHLELYAPDAHRQRTRDLRHAALASMKFLADFSPRLVGPVLHGTADEHSPVTLHVFSDAAEAVALFLDQRSIPFDQEDRVVRLDRKRSERVPCFSFRAGEHTMELLVFSTRQQRQSPLCPIEGRSMKRAGSAALQQLLDQGG